MRQIKRRSDCPISFALDIFGDKWTLLIVRDLMFKDKAHYGDFLESEEGIATNILADRLDTLECAGIIRKTPHPENKTKYIHSLTQKGIDLLPALIEIILWSARHNPKTAAPKNFVMEASRNRKKLIRQIEKRLSHKTFLFKRSSIPLT